MGGQPVSAVRWPPGPVELRGEKEALEAALADLGGEQQDAEQEELAEQLERIPELTEALREAPVAVKRKVFE